MTREHRLVFFGRLMHGAAIIVCAAALPVACTKGHSGASDAGTVSRTALTEQDASDDTKHENDGGAMDELVDKSNEAITVWLRGIERIGASDYSSLVDFRQLTGGSQVEADSRLWSARFFSRAANPYGPGTNVQRTVHAATSDTVDVLRHAYSAVGLDLVVFETAEFMLVVVDRGAGDILAQKHREQVAQIDRLADQVLATTGTFLGNSFQDEAYRWTFRYPVGLTANNRFSTDFDADVSWMWSWANRVDGGFFGGRLYFMLFKRREPSSGRIVFLDMRHWFDGKCWAPYTNIRRK